MRNFARILVTHEENASVPPRTENESAVIIVQKLRQPLEDLMGRTGYCALVSRSLAHAKTEVPLLAEARTNLEGGLEGFDLPQPHGRKNRSDGGTVMLAWMLGLLGSFIGEALTMQLVLETWPNLSLNGYFAQGNDHEKNN